MKQPLRKHKPSAESTIAITLAVVLVLLSVVAAVRHSDFFRKAEEKNSGVTSSNITIDGKADTKKSAPSDQSQSTTSHTSQSTPSTNAGVYQFTATAGDSYTNFARQAISDYASAHAISLTADQALNAEVTMTNNAGAPLLEIGQAISIGQTDIAQTLQTIGVTVNTAAQSKNDQTAKVSDNTVQVVAGDSYTTIARSALANAVTARHQTLTPAQKVAAESYVVEAAGYPEVEVGQTITISANTITSAINRATSLTAAQQAVWQPYADTIAW